MDFWIINDGEKIGPIHDFAVRKRIEAGEFLATTPAWHQGMAEWKPLVEIDLFTREFLEAPDRKLPGIELPEEGLPEDSRIPPPLPPTTAYVRRFWARWLDLTCFSSLLWLSMWYVGQDVEAVLMNQWFQLAHYIPWFFLEMVLIAQFTTTPGKWLLNIRVVNRDESNLSLRQSVVRALRVLTSGIGFGYNPISPFFQGLSYFTAKRMGGTLWDKGGGHIVKTQPLGPVRIIGTVLLFLVMLNMQWAVIAPYFIEEAGKSSPVLKKHFEENPPWHLPKRS